MKSQDLSIYEDLRTTTDAQFLQALLQKLKRTSIHSKHGEILVLHQIDPTLSAQLYPSVVRYIVVQGDIIRMVQHLVLQKIRIREGAFIVLRVTESGHIVDILVLMMLFLKIS